jgi:hypothetical protein
MLLIAHKRMATVDISVVTVRGFAISAMKLPICEGTLTTVHDMYGEILGMRKHSYLTRRKFNVIFHNLNFTLLSLLCPEGLNERNLHRNSIFSQVYFSIQFRSTLL